MPLFDLNKVHLNSLELRENIKLMKDEKMTELKTLVDLGSEFYCQSKVYV